jgi:mannose-6-phosphate isomerase-like protein (cupin superfamily)
MLTKITLQDKLALFQDRWNPKAVAGLNGQLVKLAKTDGEYVWHQHDQEDELFLVLDGRLDIHLEDGVVSLGPGELVVVPRGTRHKPVGQASILLLEPASTRSTGEVDHQLTVEPDAVAWI